MADLRFLTYGAEVVYRTYNCNPKTGLPKIYDAIVVSEVNNKNLDSRVNVVVVGKTTTSRFDVRLGNERFARCGFGFTQIKLDQITEIIDIISRYDAEEIHVHAIRASLGSVSENKADELLSRAMNGYVMEYIEPFAELSEVPVEPVDLDKCTDPLILQSVSVPTPEPQEPTVAEVDETPTDDTTTTYDPIIEVFVNNLDETINAADRMIYDGGLTIEAYANMLDLVANDFGYVNIKSALNRATKSEMPESLRTKYNLAKKRHDLVKHKLRYYAAKQVTSPETVVPDVTETITDTTETAPTENNTVDYETAYEKAKSLFRKTAKAKNLDLVSGIGDVRRVLNDLYSAPDLSEFSKAYKFKRNREKLITKLRSLCFSHGLTFENEIGNINECRSKIGLKPIIEI